MSESPVASSVTVDSHADTASFVLCCDSMQEFMRFYALVVRNECSVTAVIGCKCECTYQLALVTVVESLKIITLAYSKGTSTTSSSRPTTYLILL